MLVEASFPTTRVYNTHTHTIKKHVPLKYSQARTVYVKILNFRRASIRNKLFFAAMVTFLELSVNISIR